MASHRILIQAGVLVGIGAISWFSGLEGAVNEMSATQQKVAQTQGEVDNLMKEEVSLKADLANLQALRQAPKKVKIGTYPSGRYEQRIKSTLKDMVQALYQTGNSLISMEPVTINLEDGLQQQAPPPAPATPPPAPAGGVDPNSPVGQANAAAAAAAQAGGSGASAPSPAKVLNPETQKLEFQKDLKRFQTVTQVRTASYKLSFRGSYENIQTFVKKVAEWPELMRLSDVQFFNQAATVRPDVQSGGTAGGAPPSGAFIDDKRPIMMQVTITLYMVEETLANQYAEDPGDMPVDPAAAAAMPAGAPPADPAAASEAVPPPAG
jgi:Tfp pilus assembly protein PilO